MANFKLFGRDFDADELKKRLQTTMEEVSQTASEKLEAVSEATREISDKVAAATSEYTEAAGEAVKTAKDNAVEFIQSDKPKEMASQAGEFTVKAAKAVSFVSAYESRKDAKAAKEEADEILARTTKKVDETRFLANQRFETYGRAKCEILQSCVGRFIKIVNSLNNKVKDKVYELGTAVEFRERDFAELESVEINASNALKVAAAGGSMAAMAVAGVPAAVTSAVTAMCVASTGTAISSLSGAAASNAVLAWLGGGSVATGGGGMAAGAAVLASITAVATTVFALGAASLVATKFYADKLTEATQFLADTKEWEAKTLGAIELMNGVVRRSDELLTVFARLEGRTLPVLDALESRVPTFSPDNKEDVEAFQKAALMVKTMSEIAQTPLIDEAGGLNGETDLILAKSNTILNSAL